MDPVGLLQPMIDAAAGMSAVFVPMGQVLLALSFVLALLFATYEWWSGGAAGGLAKFVRAALIFTIPLTLLVSENWTSSMKATANFFSQELTAPILKTTGKSDGPDAIRNTITKLTKSMFPETRNPDKRSTFEKVRAFISSEKTLGGALMTALSQAFLEVLLFVLATIVSVALIFALFGPLLALQVGVIFGPLLIAWMPFQPMSHLSRNWLQFMITQGFTLVVGVAIAVIGATAIEGFTDMMQAMGKNENLPMHIEIAAKFAGFVSSAAVILFVAFMLFKADDLAAGMVGGGGAGSSAVGAVMMSKMMPRAPAKPLTGAGPSGSSRRRNPATMITRCRSASIRAVSPMAGCSAHRQRARCGRTDG